MRDSPPLRMEIAVHPRKPFFGFTKKDANGLWHLNVRSSPHQNKANAEIETECKRLFRADVKLIKGHSSSKEVLEAALDRETLEQLILENVDSFKKQKQMQKQMQILHCKNKKELIRNMAKTYVDAVKYMIRIHFEIKGIVDKPDIVGAVFGQSEGLLGEEMDLRELQKKGRVGRIEVNVRQEGGNTVGEIMVPTSMDMAETSVLAAAIETVDKVGPCESRFTTKSIEDVRQNKRAEIAKRAKELLARLKMEQSPEIDTLTEEIRADVRAGNLIEYGRDHLPAGPEVDSSDEVIVVEGRADVVNLLKHGIKNVIGMGGSRISGDIINLSRRKTIVLFVDGDRGGELNARKLHQIANVQFVAVAPDGKEVEELPQKEIIQSLRRRVPVPEFLSSIGVSEQESGRGMRFRAARVGMPRPFERSPQGMLSFGRGRGPRLPREAFSSMTGNRDRGMMIHKRFGVGGAPGRISPFGDKALPTFEAPVETAVLDSPENASEYASFLERVKGKKQALFLDADKKEIDLVPVKDMVSKLKDAKSVHTIVCDGIITKRLIDAAAKADVQLVVGIKRGKTGESKVKTLVVG